MTSLHMLTSNARIPKKQVGTAVTQFPCISQMFWDRFGKGAFYQCPTDGLHTKNELPTNPVEAGCV
jgi:hypothetical protein